MYTAIFQLFTSDTNKERCCTNESSLFFIRIFIQEHEKSITNYTSSSWNTLFCWVLHVSSMICRAHFKGNNYILPSSYCGYKSSTFFYHIFFYFQLVAVEVTTLEVKLKRVRYSEYSREILFRMIIKADSLNS